jgi:hypothetical protein
MNLYEVYVEGWIIRVKASNFPTAIRRALDGGEAAKDLKLNSRKRNYLSVKVKVIIRDVPKDYEIPDIDVPVDTIKKQLKMAAFGE